MSTFKKLILLVLPTLLVIVALIYGEALPFSEQSKLYNILLIISILEMMILGFWIKTIFFSEQNMRLGHEDSLPSSDAVFKPYVSAKIVTITALFVSIAGMLLPLVPGLAQYAGLGRAISLAVLVVLIFLAIYSLILILCVAIALKASVDAKKQVKALRDKYIPSENEISEDEVKNIKEPD